ncbi:hypothetical protein C6A85_13345, partial [Mycobacterium sp. ITM-2017-0098]
DITHQRLVVQITREQFGMPRRHSAVASDVEVPAVLGRDDTDVPDPTITFTENSGRKVPAPVPIGMPKVGR